MSSEQQEPKGNGHDKPRAEALGVVQYKTPSGVEIKLTTQIIRAYFLPDASDVEALGFAGFCRFSGVNPFLREAYLVRRQEGERAAIVVGYPTFMKRAERNRQYRGFKAGLVLVPVLDVDKTTGEVKPATVLPIKGEPVDGVHKPFIAIQGALKPPGYQIVGGWCQVVREDRPAPIVSVVPLEEYIARRRDGQPTKIWAEKTGTMIRKVPIGQAHRDAFPDELGGWYLEEEIAAQPLPREPIEPPKDEPKAPDELIIPPALEPLFQQLRWNRGAVEMFLGRYRTKTVAELETLLQRELAAASPAPPDEPQPAAAADPNQLALL